MVRIVLIWEQGFELSNNKGKRSALGSAFSLVGVCIQQFVVHTCYSLCLLSVSWPCRGLTFEGSS